MSHRLDIIGVDLVQYRHIVEQAGELFGEFHDLGFTQLESRQQRGLLDLLAVHVVISYSSKKTRFRDETGFRICSYCRRGGVSFGPVM